MSRDRPDTVHNAESRAFRDKATGVLTCREAPLAWRASSALWLCLPPGDERVEGVVDEAADVGGTDWGIWWKTASRAMPYTVPQTAAERRSTSFSLMSGGWHAATASCSNAQ